MALTAAAVGAVVEVVAAVAVVVEAVEAVEGKPFEFSPALRILRKNPYPLKRSSDFHQPCRGNASPYSGRESVAQPADFPEASRGKADEAFIRLGSIPTWQLGPVKVGDFQLPPCAMKSA